MTDQATPAKVRLTDGLGVVVNRALFDPACQRLSEWALIGPVQRAALETFAERLLAAERERCAKLCTTTPWPIWGDTTEDLRAALADAMRGA